MKPKTSFFEKMNKNILIKKKKTRHKWPISSIKRGIPLQIEQIKS